MLKKTFKCSKLLLFKKKNQVNMVKNVENCSKYVENCVFLAVFTMLTCFFLTVTYFEKKVDFGDPSNKNISAY